MTSARSSEIWKRDEVDSPCVSVCLVHPDVGICLGCHRTRAEIDEWNDLSPDERALILDELPGREKLLHGHRRRRGSRRGRRAGARKPGGGSVAKPPDLS